MQALKDLEIGVMFWGGLDPVETLGPGQAKEIDRVCRAYPHLTDDEFVRENLGRWLND